MRTVNSEQVTVNRYRFMWRISVICSLLTVTCSLLFAEDCISHKVIPRVNVVKPEYSISVAQPDGFMDLMHGSVVATMIEEFEIGFGVAAVTGGWCIFINQINATIGYTDFVIEIDKRHKEGTCEFDAILEHEFEHVAAHLSVITDELAGIKAAVKNSGASVLPVFIEAETDIEDAIERLESRLQARPEIRLLRQKLAAEREIRNKKIDLADRGWRIERCK